MATSKRKGLPAELTKDWKTKSEVADWLKVTEKTVEKLLMEGVVERHQDKFLGRVLISKRSVERYIDSFLGAAK